MPKVRLTANDRRNELFKKQHRINKAILDKRDYEFAAELGIRGETMSYKIKNPVENMTLKEWLYLVTTWPDEAILQFVRGK